MALSERQKLETIVPSPTNLLAMDIKSQTGTNFVNLPKSMVSRLKLKWQQDGTPQLALAPSHAHYKKLVSHEKKDLRLP